MLEALLAETIVWKTDPDFGYEIVDIQAPANAALVDSVGPHILEPRSFFADAGRMDEYASWVERMKTGRREFLDSYSVDADIVEATCS